jgi:hypothetical protein
MVESICGQGFTYTHEMKERRKKIVKLGQKVAGDRKPAAMKKTDPHPGLVLPFIAASVCSLE